MVAAHAFLWTEFRGAYQFDTPQSSPALEAVAERVMRLAQANPELVFREIGGDSAAQRAVSAAVTTAQPGTAIVTYSDEERDLVRDMLAQGKNGAEIQSALDHRRAAGTGAAATERRHSSGRAIISKPLPPVTGPWLTTPDAMQNGALIPDQVAQKLKGKQFSSFNALREAIWMTVAATPELVRQFEGSNVALMKAGRPPVLPPDTPGSNPEIWHIHHEPPISEGGLVYDLSALRILRRSTHDARHSNW